MTNSCEITLCVDLPDVVQEATRIEVRCGETSCHVYEHGHQGSGDWAAWIGGGLGANIIGDGGKRGYTLGMALNDATEHVRREERRRLLHIQLRDALEETR